MIKILKIHKSGSMKRSMSYIPITCEVQTLNKTVFDTMNNLKLNLIMRLVFILKKILFQRRN